MSKVCKILLSMIICISYGNTMNAAYKSCDDMNVSEYSMHGSQTYYKKQISQSNKRNRSYSVDKYRFEADNNYSVNIPNVLFENYMLTNYNNNDNDFLLNKKRISNSIQKINNKTLSYFFKNVNDKQSLKIFTNCNGIYTKKAKTDVVKRKLNNNNGPKLYLELTPNKLFINDLIQLERKENVMNQYNNILTNNDNLYVDASKDKFEKCLNNKFATVIRKITDDKKNQNLINNIIKSNNTKTSVTNNKGNKLISKVLMDNNKKININKITSTKEHSFNNRSALINNHNTLTKSNSKVFNIRKSVARLNDVLTKTDVKSLNYQQLLKHNNDKKQDKIFTNNTTSNEINQIIEKKNNKTLVNNANTKNKKIQPISINSINKHNTDIPTENLVNKLLLQRNNNNIKNNNVTISNVNKVNNLLNSTATRNVENSLNAQSITNPTKNTSAIVGKTITNDKNEPVKLISNDVIKKSSANIDKNKQKEILINNNALTNNKFVIQKQDDFAHPSSVINLTTNNKSQLIIKKENNMVISSGMKKYYDVSTQTDPVRVTPIDDDLI